LAPRLVGSDLPASFWMVFDGWLCRQPNGLIGMVQELDIGLGCFLYVHEVFKANFLSYETQSLSDEAAVV